MSDLPDRLKHALSDRYTIERELGSGGLVTVYLAKVTTYGMFGLLFFSTNGSGRQTVLP